MRRYGNVYFGGEEISKELDTLNGCVIRLANEQGISVRTHLTVQRLFRIIETDKNKKM
ncbi:MAG: hypothetical protein HDT13_03905 [Butyrivibrio sp.]|nr:hypothetical protein [Butyrivibrio sp.]